MEEKKGNGMAQECHEYATSSFRSIVRGILLVKKVTCRKKKHRASKRERERARAHAETFGCAKTSAVMHGFFRNPTCVFPRRVLTATTSKPKYNINPSVEKSSFLSNIRIHHWWNRKGLFS